MSARMIPEPTAEDMDRNPMIYNGEPNCPCVLCAFIRRTVAAETSSGYLTVENANLREVLQAWLEEARSPELIGRTKAAIATSVGGG